MTWKYNRDSCDWLPGDRIFSSISFYVCVNVDRGLNASRVHGGTACSFFFIILFFNLVFIYRWLSLQIKDNEQEKFKVIYIIITHQMMQLWFKIKSDHQPDRNYFYNKLFQTNLLAFWKYLFAYTPSGND